MPPMSPAAADGPVGPYRVTQLSIEDGMAIAMWPAPGPWAVQDALQAPRPDEGYWAVRDAGDALVGYCCLGQSARPPGLDASPTLLDVALGLAPRWTGRRLSRDFAASVVQHARSVADDRGLRCSVASWNTVGRRTAEAVGFRGVGVHHAAADSTTEFYFVFQMGATR